MLSNRELAHITIRTDNPGLVLVNDAEIVLPETLFRLVKVLAEHEGCCVILSDIAAQVWPGGPARMTRQVDYHVARLNGKLMKGAGLRTRPVVVRRGWGYLLNTTVEWLPPLPTASDNEGEMRNGT